jgi:GNAT superfamily N-acetyltransferase
LVAVSFRALIDDASRMGWGRALLGRALLRLECLFRLSVYCVNVRALKDRSDVAPSTGITYRKLTAAELLAATDNIELDLAPEFISEAMERGDLAWGAFEHDQLVGYTWRAASQAPFMDGLWVRVPRPLQYGYKSYTRPSHRGRGIYPAVSRVADEQSIELGYPAMLDLVDIANIASHRAANKLGSRTSGYAGYVKLFGRRLTFRTPGARSIGVELYMPKGGNKSSATQASHPSPLSPSPRS